MQNNITLILAILLVMSLCGNVNAADKVMPKEFKIPNLPVVAHRGFSYEYPENTVTSAKGAITAKAEGCEFDVYLSRDGVVFVMHDGTFNRTTNVKAEIVDGKPKPVPLDDLTFEEMRQLDAGSWKDAKFAGEKIPTIDEMLVVLKDSKCWPVVEIKKAGFEQQVIDAIQKAKMEDRTVIIAFSKDVVKTIRKLAPTIPVAWLWGEKWEKSDEELVEFLIAVAYEVDTNLLDLAHTHMNANVVKGLNDAGITVWCWTVNDPARMTELRKAGVVGITTDRPNIARENGEGP
jgi:glycerophosphoryl diester phosphodiesterase